MDTSRLLSERSFDQLLCDATRARAQGLVVLRDRDGVRHGVWLDQGYVVGVLVAGHFDPLLALLRRHGMLTPHMHQRCVRALEASSERAGAVANRLAGVAKTQVRDALSEQLVERFKLLRGLATHEGHDAWLELCAVPNAELTVRMPLGALLRRAGALVRADESTARAAASDDSRRALRGLAKRLHPDLHPHLDDADRELMARELSSATAAYHGFS